MSNLNSTNRLTEFPSLEADERVDGSRFSLSKFMFWKKGDELQTDPRHATTVEQQKQETMSPPVRQGSSASMNTEEMSVTGNISVSIPPYTRSESNASNPSPDSADGSVSPSAFETRNLTNVLRRLSNLVAMGSNNQADLKKYWMPDSVSKECLECGEKFTTFRRKHHCRICGQIFCSRCCNQIIPGKLIGYTGELRVCGYCCKIVISYSSVSGSNSDLTDDLKNVQEDLQSRPGANTPDFLQVGSSSSHPINSLSDHSNVYRSLPRRKASTCYQEERFAGTKDHSFNSFHSTADDKPKIVWDWVSLKSMWDEMLNPVTGIDWATHRHNMMKYCHSCVVGSELIDWLLSQRKITWRGQGVQIGQLLIDANLLECVSQAEQVFIDAYALYKPVHVPLSSVQESSEANSTSTRSSADLSDTKDWGQDPLWLKQVTNPGKLDNLSEEVMDKDGDIKENQLDSDNSKSRMNSSASYSLDLNFGENTVSISKPKDGSVDEDDSRLLHSEIYSSSQSSQIQSTSKNTIPKKINHSSATTETMTDEFLQRTFQNQKNKDMVPPTGWHSPQQLTTDGELRAFQSLCNSYVAHENNLLNQLLENMNLSQNWADIILPIVHKVTELVRPDVRNADDEMDIRQYIQFKKLPGGTLLDCRIVNGVVCTKNVAHRHMPTKLKDPNILLIGSAIDYQRFENRFLSLEPLVMQEHDYLKNTVARVLSLKPDIVLVEKAVSRLAQEFIMDHRITLVINVKPSVMERIGRLTQTSIMESADMQLGRPQQLGLCHNFYLETFQLSNGMAKTLMFFDGCATHLGCTVLLRGGSTRELMKVKKIISFLMFVAYNWRLERSFHIDSFSMPPDDIQDIKPISTLHNVNDSKETNSNNTDPLTGPIMPQDTNAKSDFEKGLDEIILSASPYITYSLPYLETKVGKACELRKFFPEILYWSLVRSKSLSSLSIVDDLESNNTINEMQNVVLLNSKMTTDKPHIRWEQRHDFTTQKFTSEIGSDDVQDLLADFRRKGSRLSFIPAGNLINANRDIRSTASSWNTLENDKLKQETEEEVGALDPFKHQRLSVLFCSYSPISANAPYFCVNPWVVNMEMYGRNDISLGIFLERYCFRRSYDCPAAQCAGPMLDHIRKFVHNNGCVEIILRELQSPLIGPGSNQNILMWSWCSTCRTVSPIVPMSVDAWSLSFAKYLELRFYGRAYKRRGFDNKCPHSLHQDHQHYFAQQNIVAAFKFFKIQLLEIFLPRYRISVKKLPKTVSQLIEDVKSVAILVHGVYNNIIEVLTSLKENSAGLKVEEILTSLTEQQKSERTAFRVKIEEIQVNLTSPSLHESFSSTDSETSLWKVTDSIGFLKCNIAETIQSWNTNLNNFILQKKKEEKQAKDTITKPLSRMESEPILPILKDLEDSLGKMSSDNASVNLPIASYDKATSLHTSVPDEQSGMLLNVASLSASDQLIKRSGSPSRNSVSQKMDHERTKSDGTDRISKDLSTFDETVVDSSSKSEKRSSTVKTLISHFITGQSSVQVIQSPWSTLLEHHFPAAYSIIPVAVYESEPSSIVAFTLGSVEYRSKIKLNPSALDFDTSTASGRKDVGEEFQTSVSSTGKFITPNSTDDKANSDPDDERRKKRDGSIEIQFSSSCAKFFCRVYFAEKFRQLRKLCLVEGEEFYIRSLTRCVSWAASGGKSGSTFCKTKDDRFVIKQMSSFEIKSFLDFAPNYFEYMKTAFLEKKPSVLVKIVGVYRVGFKNFVTNTASKMDILVMENLFYERIIKQKFDLKGSIRNRLATVTGKEQEDLVLLDENLVNMACENPIYIRPHTKTVLSLALRNDSKFLASQLVMDYSLLVGFDENKEELVVGIIDYIRTFTWDKKIETFVKSSGILGGQGKTPTVVSPTDYQTRFCEAMDRYFLLVPDRWLGLGLGIDA